MIKNKLNYKLSFNSKESIRLIKQKIISAKESVDIEIYYFNPDGIGVDIINLLKQKSKEGIKIRILLDHIGSFSFDKKTIIKDLINHGIEIRFFNSILPFSKNKKSLLFLRNHRRSIIIDNEYVLFGSICISDKTINWLELCILIKDKNLNNKTRQIFNRTWNKVYYPTFKIGRSGYKYIRSNKDRDFTYITQSPLQFEKNIYKEYINQIKSAQDSIILVSPYFSPDMRFKQALKKAVKRGVNVNIILPIKSDLVLVDIARNTHINFFVKNKIRISFLDKMIHSKFAVFDNKTAFIGTMNLDNLSLKYNYESGVLINNTNCIEDLRHYSYFLISKSFYFTKESWNKRSFLLKLIEKIIWPFRKIV